MRGAPGRMVRAGVGLWVALHLTCLVQASPGDVLAKADFRNQDWVVAAPGGTGSDKGMELDYAQNAIKLKDAGKYSWWFESPRAFFSGDMALAYNGTVEFQLQSLEWEATFVEDYDIVLVASSKRHTIGLKGIKKDGDTSKTYSVRLSELAGGWQHLHPMIRKDGGGLRTEVVKEDMIRTLSTLTAIRVRGGYYMGVEKTQLRSLKMIQGIQAGDEKFQTDTDCCSERDRTCTSTEKYELVFDNKGLDCIEFAQVSAGTLVAGDSAGGIEKTVRLAGEVSSPQADFYRESKLEITGGTCGPAGGNAGCSGTVTAYLGELSWAINSGVTAVEIEQAGTGCATGGTLAAAGASGNGFQAAFDVKYTIPSVALASQGVGCSTASVEGPFTTITVTAGVVQTVTDPSAATGAGYIDGRAVITCDAPCTGTGLVVDCVTTAGDITALTVVDGGMGYDPANAPSIYCPEGTVGARTSEGPFTTITTTGTLPNTAVTGVTLASVLGSGYVNGNAIIDCAAPCTGTGLVVYCEVDNGGTYQYGDITALNVVWPGVGYDAANPPTIRCPENPADPPNPGTGFAGTFATDGSGKIYGVSVTNAGSGYTSNIKITHVAQQAATCIEMVWTPEPSGYMTSVKILDVGSGFTVPPRLSISSGGAGCQDFVLRTRVGDATPDKLEEAATSGGIISLRATSSDYRDGYYDGMSFVWLSATGGPQVREIDSFTSVGRTIRLKTPLTATPALNDLYAITKTPALTLVNGHDFLTGLYDELAAALSCVCSGGTRTKVSEEPAATRGSCLCEVTLAASASDQDDWYLDETIYFPASDLATTVVDYTGADKKAKVAVRSSGLTGFNRELAFDTAVAANTKYVVSARHLAKVTLADHSGAHAGADTDATSTYTLSYQDYSGPMQAHLRGQPFFCEQAVGPDAPYIDMPFARTFAFRSTPLICSTATLTVAAQGRVRDDILWPKKNLTVFGEQGEVLGTLFSEPATFLGMQEGGPVTDSITLSQEKMLEVTSDGDVVFTLAVDNGHAGRADVVLDDSGNSVFLDHGAIAFRWMKLSFSPAACFAATAATDEYQVLEHASPGLQRLVYNLSFGLPPAPMGTPVSDGVLTVTADADLAAGFLELSLPLPGVSAGDEQASSLFTDWVWGSHERVYALSEPTDVAVKCVNNDAVDLQRYTITGVEVTDGGSRCSASVSEGPFSEITIVGGAASGGVASVVLPAGVTGTGYVSGKAIITRHGSGDGALVVECTANAAGDITGLAVSTAGSGYTVDDAPVIYCPEGTVSAVPTPGTVNPGQNFDGRYATNGKLNGGAIIGVSVENVGSGYTNNIKFTHTPHANMADTCTSSYLGLGRAVLAYESVVQADAAIPARVCRRATVLPLNGTRSARHTAHHRIPRSLMAQAALAGALPVSFTVVNALAAKLSPVRLTYSLMRCKMMTLNGNSGIPGLGVASFRPDSLVLPFPDDAPPAAGAATLWVHAHIQKHRMHVADARGAPNGRPRGGVLDTDSGQPYYTELLRARDPEASHKMQSRYWPHLGAIGVRAGVSGEALGWLFVKDYSQYQSEGGFVDSLSIPLRTMEQFALARKITLTLDIPPGDSTIAVLSAVVAYPHTEAAA